jgi:CHASE2 domain-containing sensor protein
MNSQILSSPLLLSLFILVFLVLLASGFFVKKGWWIPLLGILAVAGYLILLWVDQVSAVEIRRLLSDSLRRVVKWIFSQGESP